MRRTILLILVLSLVPASSAMASAGAVIRDCTLDGRLDGRYSQQDLRQALAKLPSDVDEYSNCRDIIRSAQISGGGGGGGGAVGSDGGGTGGSSGGTAPGEFGGFKDVPKDPLETATTEERQAVNRARTEVPRPIGDRSATIAGSDLPTPLWLVLGAGAVALIAFGAYDLRRRVVARRLP